MRDQEQKLVLFVLALVVGTLWLYPWLDASRIAAGPAEPETEFLVTNAANNGPGSLRDAMFRALRAPMASEIVLRVPEVVLKTPLPPLAARSGITIRSETGRSVLEAAALHDGAPVLDLRGGAVAVANLSIRGAAGYAIRVAGRDPVRIDDVVIS